MDLARLGNESYGEDGDLTRAAILALQRHFRPERVGGVANTDSLAWLDRPPERQK